MANFCTKCGAELNDEAVVCPSCGTAVKGIKQKMNSGSYFDGGVLGWIGHSILFVLLCLIPFVGIAFAICNMGKWIASHTYVDGRRLKFVGSASSLIGSVIIWEILTIITLTIYGWWVPVKICKWVASNLTFAD